MCISKKQIVISKTSNALLCSILISLFQGCNNTIDEKTSESVLKSTIHFLEPETNQVEFDTTNYNILKNHNEFYSNDFLFKQRLIVLKREKSNFEMTFKKKTAEYVYKQRITYLGSITTFNRVVLKFVRTVLYTHYSGDIRCRSHLRIYNDSNYNIGRYKFDCFIADSSYIEGTEVVLISSNPECNIKSKINFYHGIPSTISVNCSQIDDTTFYAERFLFSYTGD